MRIRIKDHDVELDVEHYDAKTKVVIVKIFGTMCKFQKHQYEVIKEK